MPVPVSTVDRVRSELDARLRQRESAASSVLWRVVHCELVGAPSQFSTEQVAEALQVLGVQLGELRRLAHLLGIAVKGRVAATVEREQVDARRREIQQRQAAADARIAEARRLLEDAEGEARRINADWAAASNADEQRRGRVTNGERAVDDLHRVGWPGWHAFDAWQADIAAHAAGGAA